MAISDLDFSAILDVPALKQECDLVFKGEGKRISDVRSELLPIFRKASTEGRQKARDLLNADGSGIDCARRISWLQDRLIEVLYVLTCQYVYPQDAPQIAVTAVGGYGRGTLAPGSDAAKALALHHDAAQKCFIARSVNFPVRHEPAVEVEG